MTEGHSEFLTQDIQSYLPVTNEEINWQWTIVEHTHNPIYHGTDILEWRRLLKAWIFQGQRMWNPIASSLPLRTQQLGFRMKTPSSMRRGVFFSFIRGRCVSLWICLLIIKAKFFLFPKSLPSLSGRIFFTACILLEKCFLPCQDKIYYQS